MRAHEPTASKIRSVYEHYLHGYAMYFFHASVVFFSQAVGSGWRGREWAAINYNRDRRRRRRGTRHLRGSLALIRRNFKLKVVKLGKPLKTRYLRIVYGLWRGFTGFRKVMFRFIQFYFFMYIFYFRLVNFFRELHKKELSKRRSRRLAKLVG